MVWLLQLLGPVAVISLAGLVASHPGETHDASEMEHQILARNQIASVAKKSLDACMGSVEAQQLRSRNVVRRANIAEELRQKRGITTNARKWSRDLATLEIYEAINHNETGIDYYKPGTPGDVVFAANTSCILTPEVTNGPYYIWGERIRKNVKEDKYCDGVDLYLEVQYLDIDTCKPVPDIYVDVWSANATGIYSGISISDSFGTNYAADGWDSTYLRGIQPTNKDGVAAFETIFPGHYTGRATHTHLLSHMNVTVNQNHTLLNGTGTVTHVGQLFYNEVLRSAVEATYPYNTNTDPVTSNADDRFSIVQASNDYDPFPEFLYLGDSITDGIFAWIQIGINTSADQSYTLPIAGWYEADGGHENPEGPQSLDES